MLQHSIHVLKRLDRQQQHYYLDGQIQFLPWLSLNEQQYCLAKHQNILKNNTSFHSQQLPGSMNNITNSSSTALTSLIDN